MVNQSASRILVFSGYAGVVAVISSCSVPGGGGDLPTSEAQAAATLPGHLAGITDADFTVARDNFSQVESIDDGVGPVFNETACGHCHTLGGIGGSGEQIERRFGRVTNGVFHELNNEGGTAAPARPSVKPGPGPEVEEAAASRVRQQDRKSVV